MINEYIKDLNFLSEKIDLCNCYISDGQFAIAEVKINAIDNILSKIKSNFKKSSEQYRYLIDYRNYVDSIHNEIKDSIYTENINLAWSLIKSIEKEILKFSESINELKKKYHFEKGNEFYHKGKIKEAFHDWTEVLKKDPTNDDIHNIIDDNVLSENKIKHKVDYLKEKFKFEYVGSVDIKDYVNGLTYFSFFSDKMFLYSRGPDLGNEDYNATVSSINLNNPELTKEVIIDNVPIKISAPAIKYIKELNLLIYIRKFIKLTPVAFNHSTGKTFNFELPVNINPINLSYILYDTARNCICILDTFAHNILMFTAKGMFVKKYIFPIDMQFPISMVMDFQDSMIVGFYQDIPLTGRGEFGKTFYPANKYFATLNLKNGKCDFINSKQNRPARLMVKKCNAYFLYLTNKTLIKTDDKFNTIFSICTNKLCDEIIFNKKENRVQINPSEDKKIIYIADTITHKRIFVFEV